MTIPDAIAVHPLDEVATALADLSAGAQASVSGSERLAAIRTLEAIQRGHKIALCDLPVGTRIRKYGEVIGQITAPVSAGCHVHTHNLLSLRIAGREREE